MKYTIACVNYFSSIFIEYQLKMLFKLNNPQEFTFVIIDNSNNNKEFTKLTKLVNKYTQHNNIILIKNNPSMPKLGQNIASIHHAEGLNIGMKIAELKKSRYFITLDADCFIFCSLNYFENIIGENFTIGTPYSEKKQEIINEYSNFPCAFFQIFDTLKTGYNLDFLPQINQANLHAVVKDVGYQIRHNFGKKPFFSFPQSSNITKYIPKFRKSKIFPVESYVYLNEEKPIALHIGKSARKLQNKPHSLNVLKWFCYLKFILQFRSAKIRYCELFLKQYK